MNRSEAQYTAFYCEENVWHLCQDDRLGSGERHVLWITNDTREVAMFGQRVARADQAVVWDYHVVVLTGVGLDTVVWDLDTRLPFPVPAGDYLDVSFPPVPIAYRPRFRLMPASEFKETFASDRRHMKSADGSWLRPPPSWPPIGEGIGDGHTLESFLDLSRASPGEVLDLPELRERVG